MQTAVGDIWELSTKNDAIVITTNQGWKSGGVGVLGAGLARQASRRFNWLYKAWGEHCQRHGADAGPISWTVSSKWCRYLICFPTKALNAEKPWLSWRNPSSPELIAGYLPELNRIAEGLHKHAEGLGLPVPLVLVPSLGCQNGGLTEAQVVPLLEQHLTHPCFFHVRLP